MLPLGDGEGNKKGAECAYTSEDRRVYKPFIVLLALSCAAALAPGQTTLPTGIQRSGAVDVGRNESKTAGVEAMVDSITGIFQSIDYSNLPPQPVQTVIQSATVGPCNVVTLGPLSLPSLGSILPKILDAGPVLNLNGPNGLKQIPLNSIVNIFFSTLGGGTPPPASVPNAPVLPPLYLDAGSYALDNGSGGADVGPFTATLNVPAPLLVWTNADSDLTIDRSAGVDVQWTGGDPSTNIMIYGVIGSVSGSSAFNCSVPNNGEFMVTPDVLSLMPATPTGSLGPGGTSVLKVSSTTQTTFSAPGLDTAEFSYTLNSTRNVVYQ
jgi:hypothetical protein